MRAERGDYESAIAMLRPLAEAGTSDAQYALAFLALTECDLISGREAFASCIERTSAGPPGLPAGTAHRQMFGPLAFPAPTLTPSAALT